ncbi:MAG TPA: DNA-binding domain-containing protein [Tepidisphaeraceae bacterium]|jgi:hypothetical protein|nr:DNA-binding domain-containing protein [Tepidisphaeraceae bacterium]
MRRATKIPAMIQHKPARRQTLAEFRELQKLAAGMIMQPLGPGMRTRRVQTDGRGSAEKAAEFIKPNDRLTSLERIEIYNKQYWFRLIDILYEDYPGLKAVVGEKKFNGLVKAYLAKYPSHSYTLRNLGSRLEQFLKEEPRWTKPRSAMAMDMARFEWAQTVAFDSEQKTPLGVDDFLGKDPRKLRLGLQPYITLLELRYPLDEFTIAIKQHDMRNDASNAVENSTPRAGKRRPRLPKAERIFVVVHRHDYSLYYKRVDREQYQLLKGLREGKTLAEACAEFVEAAGGRNSDPAERIQKMFSTWAALGWFCKR